MPDDPVRHAAHLAQKLGCLVAVAVMIHGGTTRYRLTLGSEDMPNLSAVDACAALHAYALGYLHCSRDQARARAMAEQIST